METILAELADQQSFPIEESSGIAVARRRALQVAEALGFSETRAGELAIALTEAATNIIKHAGRGELLLRPLRDAQRGNGIELIALDQGPGIVDLAASMRDGTSTAGSAGSGLGAMRRLASEFDVYAHPGKGAVFYACFWSGDVASARAPAVAPAAIAKIGAISLPIAGESVCGDSWRIVLRDGDGIVVALADGLGHGPDAAAAARMTLDPLRDQAALPPGRLLELGHQRARASRGAAVAYAALHPAAQRLQFAGVGNIAACVYVDGVRRQLISYNGIVGHNLRKVQELSSEYPRDALLILHSDGLATQWDLERYPGLETRHPALIAAVLYRDFNRGSDDVSVLVVRCAGSASQLR